MVKSVKQQLIDGLEQRLKGFIMPIENVSIDQQLKKDYLSCLFYIFDH